MILFNPLPGRLVSRINGVEVYETLCITEFTEEEFKNIPNLALVVVPSNNEHEELKYLGGLLYFYNNGMELTGGTGVSLSFGDVITSNSIGAVTFLGDSTVVQLPSTEPPEQTKGVPLTLTAENPIPFEGGNKSSSITCVVVYSRTVTL